MENAGLEASDLGLTQNLKEKMNGLNLIAVTPENSKASPAAY